MFSRSHLARQEETRNHDVFGMMFVDGVTKIKASKVNACTCLHTIRKFDQRFVQHRELLHVVSQKQELIRDGNCVFSGPVSSLKSFTFLCQRCSSFKRSRHKETNKRKIKGPLSKVDELLLQ